MNLITLDFETYFDSDYTLSKMTTEEYIRDLRFKTHMCGVKWPACEGVAVIEHDKFKHFNHWGEVAVLCHHAHFDGLILNHHYGGRPAFWFDTLSMARMVMPHTKSYSLGALAEALGLGAKEIEYESFKGMRDLPPDVYTRLAAGCAQDVELTYKVFQKLLPYVPKDELRIIDLTVRMFTEPALVLDRPLMEWYVAQLKAKKEALLAQLGVTKKDLGSNDRFAQILRDLGVEPPTKISPTSGEPIYAFAKTDEGMRMLLDDEDDQVALLAEARVETKSTGTQTRGQRLLGMDARGALPVYLNYCGAHTLRDSGGDSMNWQNFKRIDFDAEGKPVWSVEQRGMVRLAICAPAGYVIAVADASQIECRLLNWFAGQQDVVDMFRSGVDVYCAQASRAMGREITKKDKVERQMFKTAELGLGYGMGHEKFSSVLKQQGLDADAKAMVKQYRSTHSAVQSLWKEADGVLHLIAAGEASAWRGILNIANRRVYGPGGTWLDYTNLEYKTEDKEWQVHTRRGNARMYGAKLAENVIQWLARTILMQNAIEISKRYKIVMRTHDELVALVPEAEGAEAVAWMCNIMRTPPAWCQGVPLDAEGGFDVRYSK